MGKKQKLPVEPLKASKTKPIPVKIVSDVATSSPVESSKEQRNWRAEDALRDIQRAKKHEQDKELMRDVNSLKKIC